jgi:hypothetical protein
MPLWAPRLFSVSLLLLLGAVLGHAAEHEGWVKGIFHCSSSEACHAHHDAAPCENSTCHSHDEISDQGCLLTSLPSLDVFRVSFEASAIALLPAVVSCPYSRLPNLPPGLTCEVGWSPGLLPLLI